MDQSFKGPSAGENRVAQSFPPDSRLGKVLEHARKKGEARDWKNAQPKEPSLAPEKVLDDKLLSHTARLIISSKNTDARWLSSRLGTSLVLTVQILEKLEEVNVVGQLISQRQGRQIKFSSVEDFNRKFPQGLTVDGKDPKPPSAPMPNGKVLHGGNRAPPGPSAPKPSPVQGKNGDHSAANSSEVSKPPVRPAGRTAKGEAGKVLSDESYNEAARAAIERQRIGFNWLEKDMGFSYSAAAAIQKSLERDGIIGPKGPGLRQGHPLLIETIEEFEERFPHGLKVSEAVKPVSVEPAPETKEPLPKIAAKNKPAPVQPSLADQAKTITEPVPKADETAITDITLNEVVRQVIGRQRAGFKYLQNDLGLSRSSAVAVQLLLERDGIIGGKGQKLTNGYHVLIETIQDFEAKYPHGLKVSEAVKPVSVEPAPETKEPLPKIAAKAKLDVIPSRTANIAIRWEGPLPSDEEVRSMNLMDLCALINKTAASLELQGSDGARLANVLRKAAGNLGQLIGIRNILNRQTLTDLCGHLFS